MKLLFVFIGTVLAVTSVYGYTIGGINTSIDGNACVQANMPYVCGWCASSGTPVPGNCSATYAGCKESWQRATSGQAFVGVDDAVVWIPDTENNIKTTWVCGDNGWEEFTTFMESGSGNRDDGWCNSREYFSTSDNRCHFCPDTGVYQIDRNTGMIDLNYSVMAGTGTGTNYNPSTMCQYSYMPGMEYGDATGRFIFAATSDSTTCFYDTRLQ